MDKFTVNICCNLFFMKTYKNLEYEIQYIESGDLISHFSNFKECKRICVIILKEYHCNYCHKNEIFIQA